MAVDCGIKHNIIRLLAKVSLDEDSKKGIQIFSRDKVKESLLPLTQEIRCHFFHLSFATEEIMQGVSLFAEGSRGALGTVGSGLAESRI